jgi:hypothetical protein
MWSLNGGLLRAAVTFMKPVFGCCHNVSKTINLKKERQNVLLFHRL